MPLEFIANQNYVSLKYIVAGRVRQPSIAIFSEDDALRCLGVREEVRIGQQYPYKLEHATELLRDLQRHVLEAPEIFENIPIQPWMRNRFGVGRPGFEGNYQWYTYDGNPSLEDWLRNWGYGQIGLQEWLNRYLHRS
jgi:hypothetical protein